MEDRKKSNKVFHLPICNSRIFVNAGIPMYSPHWFHMWQGGKQTEEDGSRYGADKQERKIKDKKTEQFLKNQVRNSGDSV